MVVSGEVEGVVAAWLETAGSSRSEVCPDEGSERHEADMKIAATMIMAAADLSIRTIRNLLDGIVSI